MGSKIEKKQATKEKKQKPILIESYDSDEDSDEKPDDEYNDDDDDEVEFIEKKRKKPRYSSDEEDNDSDVQEIQDESNPPLGSVRRKYLPKNNKNRLNHFRVTKKLKNQLFNVNHPIFNIDDHHQQIQDRFMIGINFSFILQLLMPIFTLIESSVILKNIQKVLA